MIYLTKILTILYGVVMALATISSYHELPAWLTLLNFLSGLCLIAANLFNQQVITISFLGILLLVALANGFALNGQVNWFHWLLRLFLTAILVWLNWPQG
ncbi:hypothetical protein [Lactobacillus xylocopicola]|uniref:Integral membrane protein n=1 Tax=Lactobacillus xylocopicola TaxID=2976676 RepID=A0ABN6SK75_9LACO|nr:hypothetical protein [Lactobacillus xylocopicola]BDR60650.1 hypothetical protein KIM322_09110 [Lactobacillus xylocopicola]